ncbi:sushi, von Willebrand factor type A, EGF and pentraxin domain-containing protein 1-like isoform X3 [Lytechinus pictus]|uniref:sushi, von Willebrand factor type A, EGF and pentraxin domain-containing protein 1-like isoform X3 n=1 Tax=Lytechinus pictus TaxID=7653 RepID=UPI0030B9C720
MSNRNWGGGNQFICIPNSICGDPPIVDNASLQPSNKHFFLPGDTRSYVCNSGFSIRGSREITCDADYEWSEQAFSCTPRSCGYPGRLPNADLTTRVYQYRSRAVYVCREGYENPPYTLNYRTCLENGEWSRILPTCEPVRCPEILGIANGRVDSWGDTFESQVRFECNEGYRLDGSQRRVCQGDKTWSGTETVCTEVICEDQGTLINGYKTNEKSVYRLNDVIYYHCNDGFTRDGEPLSYCTESGNWQYPMPVCGESCTVPPHPRDGQWTNLQPESIVTHNTRLELRCRNWRFTERLNNVRCNDGEWSDSDAVRLCKGRPCGMRGSNDIALNIAYDPPISDEDRSSHLIPHDTRVHYECERGYRLNGNQEMRCSQGSYGYGSNVPTCEPVPCQEEGVPHGKFVYTSPSQPLKRSNPHHGDTRRLDCRNGYRPWGFTQSRCDNGQWDNNGSQDFRCEPKPCEPLENVMNKKSISYSTSQENGKYSHGTVLTVHCNTDYIPAYGNGTVTCNASRWWPVIPTCLHSRNKIKESDSSQTPSWRGNFIDSAWLARDGHKDSGEEYCSRTRVTKNPWWKTVMDVVYNLTLVKIYNRLDRNYHRYDLVGAEVRIGVHEDYSRNQLCGAPITHQQVADSNEENHGIAIRCVRNGSAGIYGSVVSVHIPTGPDEERELSLCEVEVYEEGSSISVNGPRNGSRVGCIVPDVENADITNIGIAKQQFVLAGTSIRISCNAGHTLRGSDDSRHVGLHCLDSSSWDESEPVCEPLRMERLCSKPGYIFQVRQYVNGEETKELVTYPNDEIPEGTFLVSRCSQPGQYVLRGSANRTCLDGQWTGQEPSCVLADTSIIFQNNQPLEVRNDGTIIIFPRSQLYIYCRLPFDSNKAAYLVSDRGQSGAYWNPYPLTTMIMNLNPPRPSQSGRFTCRSADSSLSHSVNIQFTEIYCAQPQTPANGGYRNYDFHQPIEGHYMGKSITYTCDNGYVLHGQRRITCILGEWSHPAPTCQRATCEELHAPDNGMIVGGNRIGDSVLIGCNRGYRLHGENFLDCLETGEWSHPMSVCVVRMERLCSKPGYIFQVRQYVNGEETKELVTYPNDEIPEGTFLVSRCSQPGQYVLRGSANRTCLDGQWTGQEPSCVLADTSIIFQNNQPLEVRNDGTIIIFPRSQLYIYCRLPFDSNKVAYLESDRGQSGAYWNHYPLTTMIMTLNPPRPSQSGRFTCRSADSTLSHSVNILFTEIYCAQPQTPANGGYRNYDFHQPIEGHYMGKSITYTCDNGYVLHGQRRITCILGEWSHPAPTCQRATCEELHAPDNGMIVGGNRIGDSVLIGCNRGYRLHGENFLDCLETGEWSHPMSVCVETPQPVRPCDLVNCEVWQMCETDINGVGECLCISPRECPETEEPSVVCGTDGQNYTNLCQLKAYACQRGSGVEVASNSTSCIIGVPERVPLTSAPDVYESPSMSSSFDIHVDSGPSFPEETQPAVEEPEANAAHLFCHASDCPAIPGTEYCRNATAIVIAYPYNWDDQNGIMTIEIYEVIRGDLPSWTKESHQEVHLDVEDLSIGDCVCPSFESQDPVIIRFTQNLTQDGIPWLLNTDIVLLYSQQLSDDIEECLQELEREPTPEVQGDQSNSFSSYNEQGSPAADGDPPSVDGGQTASVSRVSVASPTASASASESSWDI